MKKIALALALAAVVSTACDNADKSAPKAAAVEAKAADKAVHPKTADKAADKMSEVSVIDLQKMIADKKATVYDANGEATRTKYGVIPGATLLTSFREYDLSVLPAEKDKTLVFYCSSTQCSASDGAAARAKKAGHKDVHVLRAGISGWVKEGAKVDAFTAPAKKEAKAKKKG